MKATGIVRRVDELGRIVLPIELRKSLDINEKDPVEIFTEGDGIVLKKYQPGCLSCGSMDDLTTVNNKTLCRACIQKFLVIAR